MGLRTANDLMVEISYHLVESVVDATILGYVTAGVQTVLVSSVTGIYVGAQVVVSDANSTHVVTVTAFTLSPATITANFPANFLPGSLIFAGTFPTQQPTDPLFTQSEILGYLARAQNEFLSHCPCVFAFASQDITLGNMFQEAPADAIELERIAVETTNFWSISSIIRSGNVVTAYTVPDSGLIAGQSVTATGVLDNSFNGDFTLTGASGATLTWAQTGVDAASSGGQLVGPPTYTRLYETTQEQIAMRDPQWFYNSGTTSPLPQAWFEDRAGVYGWGVAPPPQAGFTAELLYSTRGPDSLGLLDTFLIPDNLIYIVKYKALAYIWSKDGEQRSPSMARYAQQRFDRAVLFVDRYLRGLGETLVQK